MDHYRRGIIFGGKLILSLLFLTAGITKIIDPEAFASSIASFRLVPEVLIPYVVRTIPILEIIIGIGMHYKPLAGGSIVCVAALSFGFAIFYAAAIARGIQPSCGCFGSISALNASPIEGLLRACLLCLLAGAIWLQAIKIALGGKPQ